ncbi:MAG: YtxH domain-containing protein [Cytophagales bacterium]|jgi:gas vesicle protein|nr:YtxH domain-containing protein [Cytophagales bacterium]MCA6365804.1 YtxH domain-containing protein [Cytophagales bacterium]MCA6373611.1 YtxH domain-containing protein [Cytophagales bacterium]MCA6376939.1 YtxH domain-containing protein [Cytophagales bacterium]MCA6385624.1 YtxH domain-containing protein [Cytophagales bacterium]
MNTTSKVLTGVLVGASVGIIAGILIAPDSGKRTREKIVGKTRDLRNLMTDSMADVKNAYNRELESLMNNGKSGIDSMKNALKV